MAYRDHPAEPRRPSSAELALRRPEAQLRRGAAYEVHALYVALAGESPAGRQAAGYLGGIAGPLEGQGVFVEIYRVRPKDLRDRRVLDAFRRRGIDRLPAALARGRPVVGLAEIRAYYADRASEPPAGPGRLPAPFAFAFAERPRRPPADEPRSLAEPADEDGSPEAELEDYFCQEIMGGRGGDDSDTGFGAA